jgi:bifunctional DNase/RNase
MVAGLGVVPPAANPLVLLRERRGQRVVPIGIGPLEAQAIALALQGVQPPRPMTHDVFVDVIARLAGHVRRVEITELIENTFYARLILEQAGQEQSIDIRPSDAIALALRTEAPIHVAETVVDKAGIIPEQREVGASSEQETEASGSSEVDESKLAPFKDFIETLNIDDLGESGPEKPPPA